MKIGSNYYYCCNYLLKLVIMSVKFVHGSMKSPGEILLSSYRALIRGRDCFFSARKCLQIAGKVWKNCAREQVVASSWNWSPSRALIWSWNGCAKIGCWHGASLLGCSEPITGLARSRARSRQLEILFETSFASLIQSWQDVFQWPVLKIVWKLGKFSLNCLVLLTKLQDQARQFFINSK